MGKAHRRVSIESSTPPLDPLNEGYNNLYETSDSYCFLRVSFYRLFLVGCAGPATRIPKAQIDDTSVKADAEGGAKAAVTAEKPAAEALVSEKGGAAAGGATAAPAAERPAEKVYVDKKGRMEISSTPFGYVKREKKLAEKEASASGPERRESVVPLIPQVKAPAAPSAPRTEPLGPATAPYGEKAPERTGQISFDFDDADLYAVIRTMADLLKINYIIDPGISGKVTIHTAGRLQG